MPRKKSPTSKNRLLAALPAKTLADVSAHFETVDLPLKQVLSKPGKPFDYVYFPLSGMISLVQRLEDGGSIEAGLIGREGFLGVPLLLGAQSSPIEAMVQSEGVAVRMAAKAFIEAKREPLFQAPLLPYAQALHIQVTQTAVCNGRHTIGERLARWLLEAQDRIGGTELPLKHEFLSFMLGTRRSGITVALGQFSTAGLVTTGRGHIGIRDRKGVETAACECYRGVVRAEYKRLLP